jgi:dGTPase
VQEATFATGEGPFVRYHADLVVPEHSLVEMAVLKGIAALYVMQADDRVALMTRQRELVSELVEALVAHAPASLERAFADDWDAAPDDAARLRVVIDQVASLTDASAATWHERLVRQGSGAKTGWRA